MGAGLGGSFNPKCAVWKLRFLGLEPAAGEVIRLGLPGAVDCGHLGLLPNLRVHQMAERGAGRQAERLTPSDYLVFNCSGSTAYPSGGGYSESSSSNRRRR
jgi:hypothetical protein